jgi:hypothetical protein
MAQEKIIAGTATLPPGSSTTDMSKSPAGTEKAKTVQPQPSIEITPAPGVGLKMSGLPLWANLTILSLIPVLLVALLLIPALRKWIWRERPPEKSSVIGVSVLLFSGFCLGLVANQFLPSVSGPSGAHIVSATKKPIPDTTRKGPPSALPALNPLPTGGSIAPGSTKKIEDKDELIEQKRNRLSRSISEQDWKVGRLRQTNHIWNISFVATGVFMTLLATALGAVGSASEKAKAKTTITIALIGAIAAASQTIASKIPVARRAGDYAKIEAALVGLRYRAEGATTNAELELAQNDLQKQITRTGEVEASD